MNALREAIIAPLMPIVWMMFMASPAFVETDSSATEILVYVSVLYWFSFLEFLAYVVSAIISANNFYIHSAPVWQFSRSISQFV